MGARLVSGDFICVHLFRFLVLKKKFIENLKLTQNTLQNTQLSEESLLKSPFVTVWYNKNDIFSKKEAFFTFRQTDFVYIEK